MRVFRGILLVPKSLSEFVMSTLRQVPRAVRNACATSSLRIRQVLARTESWLTDHTLRVFARLRRLERGARERLRGHSGSISLILATLFVGLVVITVIGLIVGAFLVPLTAEYTLATRYSYVSRAIATLVAPIVTVLTTKRQWVRFAITVAIELYLGSLFLDLINIMNIVTR